MARPQTKLQVTTFPFLAVLLCAMGSLLLFLFIMDRRARIVSQNRAREALELIAAKKKDTQAERDARQAEWEQAKEKLRRLLLEQQQSLSADAKSVEQNLLDADRLLEIAQARFLELQPKLDSEAAKIATMQHQIERERANIKAADRQEEASKLERTKATLELAELTIAFQELKARRSRETETYSLVPYRGKQGDARTPVYVECVGDGVLFHPEKALLHGSDFTIAALRSEVERRTGPLLLEKSDREKSRTAPEEKKGPYVLFLIRPNGIANYYKAQAGLRGFQLDFGYELVDEDWVLDFGGAGAGPNHGGSRLADQKPVPPPPIAPLPVAPAPVPLMLDAGPPSPVAPTLPSPPAAPPALPSLVGNGGTSGPPALPNSVPGPIGANPPSVGGATIVGPRVAPVGEPAFVPLTRFAPKQPSTSLPRTLGQPALIASSTSPPVSSGDALKPGPGSLPAPAPVALPQVSSGSPQVSSVPPSAEENPKPSLEPIINQGPAQATFGGPEPRKKTPATPTSRLVGNKDFVMTVDCYDDHVTIFPGGVQFRWKGTNTRDTDQAVVQTIAKLIERRQASAREGEPPYRPVIRFQVSPEGLRTYLHVYPILEPLRVPMTRVNVED